MPNPFISALADEARLTETEVLILEQAGVRNHEDVDSLVQAFPSIADAGFRVPYVSNFVTSRLRPAYGRASAALPPRPSGGLGAKAPRGSRAAPGATVGAPSPAPITPAILAGTPISLRSPSWPVRNQGNRGTCVAFGATACVEFGHWLNAQTGLDLSEQFLYWAIKDHSADPDKVNDGTYLGFAAAILATDGLCEENLFPYVDPLMPPHPVAGPPPTTAAISDAAMRRNGSSRHIHQPASFAATVYNWLQQGRPVAVTLPVFASSPTSKVNNWETYVAKLYGHVLNPTTRAVAIGGHCVCITGFEPDSSEPNGGFFVFRNSWGRAWASLAPTPGYKSPESGYGEVSATYVELYGWEALQV